jgi:ketosteroid isomerase-like protein
MSDADRLEIVRDCYRAYETNDRALVERHLAADFEFFSPADVGIDRERYFERCWPNATRIDGFAYERLAEVGDDEVLVTYEAMRTDGSRFRNTEMFTFAGDKVRRVEVYFGWNLPA